jgi:glycosyltransferase involved in cell wall biosynthesis
MFLSSWPIKRILYEAARNRSDVVDIQFEYRLFGSHFKTLVELPTLALLLNNFVVVVVTVHGVLTYSSLAGQRFRLIKWLAYALSIKATSLFSDRLIVHSEGMKRELTRFGIENISVIPHGSGPLRSRSHEAPSDSVLFFGFIRHSKGLDNLIRGFADAKVKHPSSTLTIAGPVNDRSEQPYLQHLKDLTIHLGVEDSVTFLPHSFTETEMEALAERVSILVLPYTDEHVEVSGVAHDFAGFGLSLICSQTPRFSELTNGVDCLKAASTPEALSESLSMLYDDSEMRERLASNLRKLGNSESWKNVAVLRSDLYRSLVAPEKAILASGGSE